LPGPAEPGEMAPPLLKAPQYSPDLSQLLAALGLDIRKTKFHGTSHPLYTRVFDGTETRNASTVGTTPKIPIELKPDINAALLRLGRLLNILWKSTYDSPVWSEIWTLYLVIKNTQLSTRHIAENQTTHYTPPNQNRLKTSEMKSNTSRFEHRAWDNRNNCDGVPLGKPIAHQFRWSETDFSTIRIGPATRDLDQMHLLPIFSTPIPPVGHHCDGVQRQVHGKFGVPPKVVTDRSVIRVCIRFM
jgi:hypothetical protein